MRYVQVDVFSPKATKGNPVAVVLDGRNLTDRQMKDFATWTNLSEATFFVDPCDPTADYAIRIFSFKMNLLSPDTQHLVRPTHGSLQAASQRPRGLGKNPRLGL